ncbi:MAG TPA: hypothetical protein VGL77_13980 [Armatimonadota bacterium]
MAQITQHAFLTPGHNCWLFWTAEGSKTITNEGTSHRALESLVYAIDLLATQGWRVENIFVEQATPSLVMLNRAGAVIEELASENAAREVSV